jgi:outer membrane biosynthesis protein TonB
VLLGFLSLSVLAQAGVVYVYERLRPLPPRRQPTLTVTFAGSGAGKVVIEPLGRAWNLPCVWRDVPEWVVSEFCSGTPVAEASCASGEECSFRYEPGYQVRVKAEPASGSFLDGWSHECRAGEPFAQCTLVMNASENLTIFFDKVPQEVELETVATTEDGGIDLPEDEIEADLLDEPAPVPEPPALAAAPPEPEPEAMPPETPPVVEPEPPPPVEPPPPPPPPPQKKPPEPQAPPMKSVELDDQNLVKEAPSDAQFLSDKNRDVAEEAHARDSNLERQQQGDRAVSEKSKVQSPEVGAEETVVADLEDSEASSLDAQDERESAHTGDAKLAKGVQRGDGGGGGNRGDNGDGGDSSQPGMLSMRGIEGRGAPGGPRLPPRSQDTPGSGGKPGRRGQPGRSGIKTELTQDSYERIVGKDTARDELELARRQTSKRKGRWERKLGRVQSALENFTPEIKPGNQTALKTRAEPFAVYVARMHRKIHELWGFGFIEELDAKPATHELNNWNLATKIEVVVNPDGTVAKATVVDHSGVLAFDVAALDTVFAGEPYDATPQDIRSPDGKVYLHWRFHRDWRQCGTFGVDKFIRKDVPTGGDTGAHQHGGHGLFDGGRPGGRARPGPRPDSTSGTEAADSRAAAARAVTQLPVPDDPAAERAALAWISGFEHGQTGEMVNVSGAPFRSRGQIVANDKNGISAVYTSILRETPSRKVVEWKVLSPAGYRRMYRTLPPGADATTSLLLVVRIARERFTLTLTSTADGHYQIVALDR